jgi:DNA-binding IclR family transcriptional regulator
MMPSRAPLAPPTAAVVPLVQSVQRVLDILEAFSVDRPTHTLASLSTTLGLPKSTVRRLLLTLEEAGFVDRFGDDGRFRLTMKLVRMAGSVLVSLGLRTIAPPVMHWVRDRVEDTVYLNALDHEQALVVDKVDGNYPIRNVVEVGSSKPLYTGAGSKVLLAFAQDSRLLERVLAAGFIASTPHTITDSERLRAELERIREQGYCIASEDHVLGATAVSAPIRDHSGHVVASLSVAGITPRYGPDRLPMIIETVVEGACRISVGIGYQEEGIATHGRTRRQ